MLARVQTLQEQAKARGDDSNQWGEVLAAADQALASIGDLRTSEPGRGLVALRAMIADNEKQAIRDKAPMAELGKIRANRGLSGHEDPAKEYAEVFHRYDLDLKIMLIDEAITRLKTLPQDYQREMVQFLDDWVSVVGSDAPTTTKILALAQRIDPDPERNQLRSLLGQPDLKVQKETLRAMARGSHVAEFGPSTALLLAAALGKLEDTGGATFVLRTIVVRHPGDFWVNFELAKLLADAKPPQPVEAIRFYSAARALRPSSGSELAGVLFDQGKAEEANAIRSELTRLQPDNPRNWSLLIGDLNPRGKTQEARELADRWIAYVRAPLRDNPDDAIVHFKAALVFAILGDRWSELAELKEAARCGPQNPDCQQPLARFLLLENDLAGAIEAYRAVVRLDPKNFHNLYELAFALCLSGDHQGEIVVLHDATRLESANVNRAESNSRTAGLTPRSVGDYHSLVADTLFTDGYFSAFDQGYLSLGNALAETGDLRSGIAAYRESIRLKEDGRVRFVTVLGSGSIYELYTEMRNPTFGPTMPRRALVIALTLSGDLRQRSPSIAKQSGFNPNLPHAMSASA